MAKHNIFVDMPRRELGKVDAIFEVFTNSKKSGTITISKGGLEWYPNAARKAYKVTWKQFDQAIRDYKD